MRSLLKKVFGSAQDKNVTKLYPVIEEINELEPQMLEASDDEFKQFRLVYSSRYQAGESLDDMLPEVFASVREAARRALGQRHFDVQMMGGIVLHQGKIAEMRTGEGKTLTATSAVALNALTGEGVHLITVNDYLARRDTQWMGRVYNRLGLSIGCIQHDEAFLFDPDWESPDPRLEFLRPVERREAYGADITYGTNNEFGFDYLRDNMVVSAQQQVQRGLNFAIVDEVDNILIDEARTPLIISGQAERSTDKYYQFAQIVRQLRLDRHYEVDLKHKTATLTEEGVDRVEQLAGIPDGESIYDDRYIDLTHYLEQALKAEAIFHLDKDYIVRDGEVIIVDEFTGRMMVGRRYSEGLHQAIEAKEGVRVQRQNVTMATITFQNYFRMYNKLAGMTGTAETEEEEFLRIYNLPVVVIPTNRPMIRDDFADLVYNTETAKFNAVIDEIEEMRAEGRPVLVGTVSIEASERLSFMLTQRGIPHDVLNAKQHEREATIVSGAGQPGMVTIATNMAGRGTDIVLGPGVAEAGGLHIVGTERHEARRIDNQLRGRSGRQGDPGSTRFYLSLDDELMRRFGTDRIRGIMGRLGMDDETPIEHGIISKSIESAQTKVEGHNSDIRRHVVQYDDVMNRHREVIYADRGRIVSGEDMSDKIDELVTEELESIVDRNMSQRSGDIDYEGVAEDYNALFPVEPGSQRVTVDEISGLSHEDLIALLQDDADEAYQEVEDRFGPEAMRQVERHVLLSVIDRLWVEHLTAMDELREGVGLQAYGQKDPLVVYKTEGFRMFGQLTGHIRHDTVHTIFRVKPAIVEQPVQTRITEEATTVNRLDEEAKPQQVTRKKVGANAPCPCGSGKKFKHCHGRVKSHAA
ncbi:MAG TPA: preprotein translocase subunit SecA [Thermomicrobiales bacterium]|nr:preprotein translocase subunit SecA [Thermomicrobiales bacterium]